MKSIVLGGALSLFAGAAFAADPLEGVWRTEVDDGAYAQVTIIPCGPAFCGTITASFHEDGSPYESENVGKMIVIDMLPQGEGQYEGSVYRPSNEKTYYGTISLDGDVLKLAGCVFGGLICAKQTWAREQ